MNLDTFLAFPSFATMSQPLPRKEKAESKAGIREMTDTISAAAPFADASTKAFPVDLVGND